MAVKLALAFGTLLIVTLIILSLIAAGTWLIDRALDAWDYGDEDEQVRGRTDDGKIMVDAEKHRELQARVKDLEHEIKMAKRHLRDVLSERHAIEAALSDERQKAKKLEAENAELWKDAERWRALRELDGGEIYALLGDCDGIHPEQADAAIDQARGKEVQS